MKAAPRQLREVPDSLIPEAFRIMLQACESAAVNLPWASLVLASVDAGRVVCSNAQCELFASRGVPSFCIALEQLGVKQHVIFSSFNLALVVTTWYTACWLTPDCRSFLRQSPLPHSLPLFGMGEEAPGWKYNTTSRQWELPIFPSKV
eukprot:6194092-Pleurochrysis_carterae.AAC.1